jgi:hypothetical protein
MLSVEFYKGKFESMCSYPEKLRILSDMIAFSQEGQVITNAEYTFLKHISDQLGVTRLDLQELLEASVDQVLPESSGELLLQFHRLALQRNPEPAVGDPSYS